MYCKSSTPGTALSTILGIKQRTRQTPILTESTFQRGTGKTTNKRNKENTQDEQRQERGSRWG